MVVIRLGTGTVEYIIIFRVILSTPFGRGNLGGRVTLLMISRAASKGDTDTETYQGPG